ncbi:MAG: hypothetical protein AVDCRST_MAG56-2975 [uncultured Cytophagales bacterium]|uniref:HNH domain-containing protein n=1 Tax=uncultured Cytophagales bacterium TaxID=158755 RepID=A0A6J4J8H1_9SPHI|nr:MAG: hypothetical protein AVDCRST_MAG56-2975 [uncultured Cytophagales bacterium]
MHLDKTQLKVDGEPTFESRAKKASSLWDSKGSGQGGKKAFGEIRKTLLQMCVGVEICNYCEHNEATDIEHVYPKKSFPEKAFRWENYILSCGKCNTDYKSDKFAVFNPLHSADLEELPRQRGTYSQPANADGVLINPRWENPLDYLWLDIQNKSFHFTDKPGISLRDCRKAKYTIELLGLNARTPLVEGREVAAKYYLDRLERYVRAKHATTFADLEAITQDPDMVDETQPFEAEQARIMDAIRSDIAHHQHPTVWQELKRQRGQLPKTGRLLAQAPEALEW